MSSKGKRSQQKGRGKGTSDTASGSEGKGAATSGAGFLGRVFSEPKPVLDFLYYALALLGIIVVVHLWIQSGRGFDRGCFGFSAPETVTPSVGCEAVIGSDAGKLFGVSNIVWGLLFYIALAGVSFFSIRQSPADAVRTKTLRLAMIAVGLVYSAYLSYVQYFQLGEFCKLCLTSASIVLLLAIVSAVDLSRRN